MALCIGLTPFCKEAYAINHLWLLNKHCLEWMKDIVIISRTIGIIAFAIPNDDRSTILQLVYWIIAWIWVAHHIPVGVSLVGAYVRGKCCLLINSIECRIIHTQRKFSLEVSAEDISLALQQHLCARRQIFPACRALCSTGITIIHSPLEAALLCYVSQRNIEWEAEEIPLILVHGDVEENLVCRDVAICHK